MRTAGRALTKILLPVSLFVALVFTLVAPVIADNVVQSYSAADKLQVGQIVRLSSSTEVALNPSNRSDLMFGVVVDKSQAPIVLDRQGATTYVTNQGEYPVLVSNEAGPISKGDYISMSSTSGVGAKAGSNDSMIIGTATGSFDGKNNVVGTDGKYNIGKVTVSIDIIKNPSFKNTLAIPGVLQKIGNSIAGRETSPLRIYISLVLFIVATALTLVLLVVGTRGGLVAIGRNPLSKHIVLRALAQVILVAFAIFFVSLIGVYLILKV